MFINLEISGNGNNISESINLDKIDNNCTINITINVSGDNNSIKEVVHLSELLFRHKNGTKE